MAKFQSRLSTRLTATTAFVLLGTVLFSASTHSQSDSSAIKVPDTLQLPKSFVNQLVRQPDNDQRLLSALRQFERIDLDGNGISQEDLDRKDLMNAARTRSTVVQRYIAYDLDADGVVSREELTNAILWKNRGAMSRSGGSASARLRMKQRINRQLEPFERADLNRDDQLDMSEVFELAKSQAATQLEQLSERRQYTLEGSIMSLDFNADGVVSEQEFIAAISKLTPESTMGTRASPAVRVVEPGCAVPQVKSDEKLVLVGAYDGAQISSVTILGQDKSTWAAEAHVKKGKDPLYVMLTSYQPVVWKFTGATSRIRRVVLSSLFEANKGVAGSGLTGVEKSKVSFVTGTKCLQHFYKRGGLKEAQAKAKVRDVTGREPDYVLVQRSVTVANLPDGPIEKNVRDNRSGVRIKVRKVGEVDSQKLRVSRSGPMKIDASEVVSQKPAVDYEVLPGRAGLAQLLKDGKIEHIDRRTYRIKQKIHVPAGLFGGNGVKFLLPKGVPEPVGDLGHSCLFSEETGRTTGRGGTCR